jgi:hypothetical protein
VLLLPYLLGNDDLYRRFRRDESWDSPHNKNLLPAMPAVFEAPALPQGPNHTPYQVFVGPGAVFDPNRRTRLDDLPDGASATIMIVEAARLVPWTQPDDLAYDPNQPLPEVGYLPGGGFHACMCDGSVKRFDFEIRRHPGDLRALISPRDGVKVDLKRYSNLAK